MKLLTTNLSIEQAEILRWMNACSHIFSFIDATKVLVNDADDFSIGRLIFVYEDKEWISGVLETQYGGRELPDYPEFVEIHRQGGYQIHNFVQRTLEKYSSDEILNAFSNEGEKADYLLYW